MFDAKGRFEKGHEVPEEWRKAVSAYKKEHPDGFKKGHAVPKGWREKTAQAHRGLKPSDETRKRMSISQTKAYAEGRRKKPIGLSNPQWKGGQFITQRGYMVVKCPDHPRASSAGYVGRATLALEKKIGRYLERHEIVHHINGNKLDDRPENLRVMGEIEHARWHGDLKRKRKFT